MDFSKLAHQKRETFRLEGLRPIRKGVLRIMVDFNHQTIRANGDGGF
jgi:hypothetical protein